MELLVKIRAGGAEEEEALDDLYDYLYPGIVNWVKKNGGSPSDGKDAFQHAMLVFYDYLRGDKFGGEQKVRAFLWQTARYAWLMKCRRDKHDFPLADSHDTPDSGYESMMRDLLNDEDNREEILNMISQACQSCRELLELQFFQGYSNEALADHFQNKENSIKVRRSNCLKTIREHLRSHPEYLELFTVQIRKKVSK